MNRQPFSSYTTYSNNEVSRTVEVIPAEVMVDLDADGAMVGIETIGRPLDNSVWLAVVRAARFPDPQEDQP